MYMKSYKILSVFAVGVLVGVLILPNNSFSLETLTEIVSTNSGEEVSITTDTINPSIELRDNDGDGGFPFIDFSNDAVIDSDFRIILLGDDAISFQGAKIDVDLNGEFVSINTDVNNPTIEFRDADGDGGFPFIDFSNDAVSDFDARMILTGDDAFDIQGTTLNVLFGGELVSINTDSFNPSIELRDTDGDGGFPFIDFSNDGAIDFDIRLIVTGDDVLEIQGGDLRLTGNILSDGDICIGNCP